MKINMAGNAVDRILKTLHKKFGENLIHSLNDNRELLEQAEVKAKSAYFLGNILAKENQITNTQKQVVKIYDEVFIDLTTTCYLSCCAMDNSSRTILRRVLELGYAIIYLWDQPTKFWNWTNDDHSSDLNFKEMLDYTNSKGYFDFVSQETSSNTTVSVKKDSVNDIYRELSNVIHGRSLSFESTDPDRFNYKKHDIVTTLHHIIKTENILLSIWKVRFPAQFTELERTQPSLKGYGYEC